MNAALARLRANFQLAMLVIFAACGVLAITPFAVFRFATGDWVMGVIDSVIVLGLVGGVAYAWVSDRTTEAAMLCVATYTAGVAFAASKIGLAGAFWIFPTLLVNYLLVERQPAMLASVIAILLIPVNRAVFADGVQLAIFMVSAMLVVLFAYIFARVTHSQREQMQALALRDPLTGVLNRRALKTAMEEAPRRHAVTGEATGLLLLDLDHFKRINDTAGHDTGDQVLTDFAQLVRQALRRDDRLYRFGGEEFVVLVSPAVPAGLLRAAEHLRLRVSEQLRCGEQGVTVSIGVALLQRDETPAQWFARADKALYEAKQGGRDRVVVAETLTGEGTGSCDGGPDRCPAPAVAGT